MAYTRRGSKEPSTPAPGADPGLLPISKLANSASAVDLTYAVPWDGCRLAYAYCVTTTAVDTSGSMAIKLELDTAGGTQLGTCSPAAGSAVGTITELTWVDESSARHLDSANYINFEVDGSTTGTGAVDMFLYFEPDTA